MDYKLKYEIIKPKWQSKDTKAQKPKPTNSSQKSSVPKGRVKPKAKITSGALTNFRRRISSLASGLQLGLICAMPFVFVLHIIGSIRTSLANSRTSSRKLGRNTTTKTYMLSRLSPPKSIGMSDWSFSAPSTQEKLVSPRHENLRLDIFFSYIALIFISGMAIKPEVISSVPARIAIVILAIHSIIRRY